MSQPEPEYFKKWYADFGERLNKSRRDRYSADPTYKQTVLARNRAGRDKRKAATAKERSEQRGASRLRVGARSWKTVEAEIVVGPNGETATATLFTISALARSIGKSVQAVRLWEKQGDLPPAELFNKKGDRLYTAETVETIRQVMIAKGKLSETSVRPRPTRKPICRRIRYPDGTEDTLLLYRVGVLAEAAERTVVTIQILEGKGYIPETPFRASGTRYRLYSLPMIEAVRTAFETRNGEIRGEASWTAFRDEVRGVWEGLNIFGAVFADPELDLPKSQRAKPSATSET